MTALDGFDGLALQGQEISKRVPRADATPVLRVERVSKSFGECKAVAEVTFTLGASEIAAVLGPSGAGKTTLFRCLRAQLQAPSRHRRKPGAMAYDASPRPY